MKDNKIKYLDSDSLDIYKEPTPDLAYDKTLKDKWEAACDIFRAYYGKPLAKDR